jgi:thioredoxin-like negative regulator of GroEL
MKVAALMAVILSVAVSAAPTRAEIVPFIEDDYPKALAQAKASGRPLFIEAWAPWCHTCRSMRAYVFSDAALQPEVGRFVWLAIDTENPRNAAFLRTHPVQGVPMLFVADPTGAVVLRYAGAATVSQLKNLLDQGDRATRRGEASNLDAMLERADRLAAAGKNTASLKLYDQALGSAPATWKALGRAAESYVFVLQTANLNHRCAAVARDLYGRVKGTASAANVAASGLSCAAELPRTAPRRQALIDALEHDTREALGDPGIEMSADDRSGLYEALIEARDAVGDKQAAGRLQGEWAAFLEAQAAKAATPEQRAVYDSHRLSAYLALGTPGKAIPMLEQSERDLPGDYNPPARLAVAYKEMKQYDQALAASDRALKTAYGPRKLAVLRTRAEIYSARGDKQSAKDTLADAVTYAKGLPMGQRNEKTIAALRKELAGMR